MSVHHPIHIYSYGWPAGALWVGPGLGAALHPQHAPHARHAVVEVGVVQGQVLVGDELHRLLRRDAADERSSGVQLAGAVAHAAGKHNETDEGVWVSE